MPLTVPDKFEEGYEKGENFSGIILGTGGVLLGNVEANFSSGHVYNVVKTWSGIKETVDVFRETYGKHSATFTLYDYDTMIDSDQNSLPLSQLLNSAQGQDAQIFIINNRTATSTNDCLLRFNGKVGEVTINSNHTITVKLESSAVRGDTSVLKKTMQEAADAFNRTVFEENKFVQVPLVYGDFIADNSTGLAKGFRVSDTLPPRYVFSASPLYQPGLNSELYLPLLSGGPPSRAASHLTSTITGFGSLQFTTSDVNGEAVYLTEDIFHLTKLRTGDPFAATSSKHGWNGLRGNNIDDNDTATTAGAENKGAGFNDIALIIWNIVNGKQFFELMNYSSSEDRRSRLELHWQNFTVDDTYNVQLLSPFMTYSNEENATTREPLYYVNVLPPELTAGNQREVFADRIRNGTYLNYYSSEVISELLAEFNTEIEPTIFTIGIYSWAQNPVHAQGDQFFEIGEMRVHVNSDIAPTNVDFPVAYGHLQGRPYGTWVSDFASVFDDYPLDDYVQDSGITDAPIVGTMNESGAGIIASLLIDEAGVDSSEFNKATFWGNLNRLQKMRINILEDLSINDVATLLGKQSPWTFCFNALGTPKMVNVRETQGSPWRSTTPGTDVGGSNTPIRFDELVKRPAFSMTPEKEVINHLTVKSRWSEAQGKFLDETLYVNNISYVRYGPRKRTVEWKNVVPGTTNAVAQAAANGGIIGNGIADTSIQRSLI